MLPEVLMGPLWRQLDARRIEHEAGRAESRCQWDSLANCRELPASGPGSGCLGRCASTGLRGRASAAGIICMRPSCSARFVRRCAVPGSPSVRPVIPCGTRSRRTCSRTATTFVRFRSS
jgi:hypothetical protein